MESSRAQVQVEDREDGIRVLTLDNPRKKNALDGDALEALAWAVDPKTTSHVRVFVVRGANGAFCAGYDLDSLAHGTEPTLPDARLREVLSLLESHPAPSVAMVQGPAFGAGMDLACTCDLRVAEEGALFCMPPVRLGIVYAPEGIHRVARLVGIARAKRLFLTAERLPAARALDWGLVEEVRPLAELETAAFALAKSISEGAPLAVKGTRRTFALLSENPLAAEELAELERLRQEAYVSEDLKEGRAAFAQKRTPRFHGR